MSTEIQYADDTANPTTGCEGCELWKATDGGTCYAAEQTERFGAVRKGYSPKFEQIVFWPGRMERASKLPDLRGRYRIDEPWLNFLPRQIFISDMGDLLSSVVPFDYIKMEVIHNVTSSRGKRHNWCWLTKRPQRMAEFSSWLKKRGIPWPKNLWAGTSITTQKTTSRIDHVLNVGDEETLHYLSVEPQWEEIDLSPWLPRLGWIIQGGESGKNPKRFQLEWANSMRKQCAAAGVPFFLKQLGAFVFEGKERIRLKHSHGGDWSEWPEDLRIREMPDRG